MLTPWKSNPLAVIPFEGSPSPAALTLGRIPNASRNFVELRDPSETHVLLFGPNGSGKMTRVLAPNLLRLQDRSIFVIDPKGELAAITAQHRRNMGDEVIVINPFNVVVKDFPGYDDLKSSGFNPMMTLNCKLPSFNADASRIAEALIKTESQTQPYFDNAARELVAALIMYVAFDASMRNFTPTLGMVRAILSDDARLKQVSENIESLRNGAPESLHGMINKAAQFRDIIGDSMRGVLSTAREQLKFLDDVEIRRDLSGNGVDFREAKKRPVTVYMILPGDDVLRHARWLRLIVVSALTAMMRPRRKGEPRVLFMMDEFPALGHMEIIEATWALVRGYGIQMMPVFQDLGQLERIYGKAADSFIANAGAIAHFPPNDPKTAQWIIDRAGKTEDLFYNSGGSGNSTGRETSFSTNRGWIIERLDRWTYQDLIAMPNYYMLLSLARERNVWQVLAPQYNKIDAYRMVARKNPYRPDD
jgi:type IV secretion system protein VirD4